MLAIRHLQASNAGSFMASRPSGAVAVTLSKRERIQRTQRAPPSLRGMRVSSRIDPSPIAPYPNERAAHSTTSGAVPKPESAGACRCVRWWLHRSRARLRTVYDRLIRVRCDLISPGRRSLCAALRKYVRVVSSLSRTRLGGSLSSPSRSHSNLPGPCSTPFR
jgi:hypothetical protein